MVHFGLLARISDLRKSKEAQWKKLSAQGIHVLVTINDESGSIGALFNQAEDLGWPIVRYMAFRCIIESAIEPGYGPLDGVQLWREVPTGALRTQKPPGNGGCVI